jgi:hypothetical protein
VHHAALDLQDGRRIVIVHPSPVSHRQRGRDARFPRNIAPTAYLQLGGKFRVGIVVRAFAVCVHTEG